MALFMCSVRQGWVSGYCVKCCTCCNACAEALFLRSGLASCCPSSRVPLLCADAVAADICGCCWLLLCAGLRSWAAPPAVSLLRRLRLTMTPTAWMALAWQSLRRSGRVLSGEPLRRGFASAYRLARGTQALHSIDTTQTVVACHQLAHTRPERIQR